MTTTDTSALDEVTPDTDRRGRGREEESTHGYLRSPRDLLRMVVYLATGVLILVLTKWGQDGVLGLEEDLIQMVSFLTPSIERILAGALALISIVVGVLTLALPFATRRYRLFGYMFAANFVASILIAATEWWLQHGGSPVLINELAQRAGLGTPQTASSLSVAQLAADFVVLGPFVGRRWRQAGALTLLVVVVLRIIVAVQLPAHVFVALPFGAAIGAGVLLAFGRPDRRPTPAAIATALSDAGIAVATLEPATVDARGSRPYFGVLDDGSRIFVKVLGAEERAADLLFRFYRYLRLKNVGDDRPFSSLRRTVEHEALLALQARDVGIRTPRMRGVIDVGADSMLLAYDLVDGTSLDAVPDDEITDELMRDVWALIVQLRRHRIAHRDLRRSNVLVDDEGRPWLIDFGFSELAADDGLLAADVAQLLASLAVCVGVDRAVGGALDVLGRDAVAAALPRLQMPALSGATRSVLRSHKGLLSELQNTVAERAGVETVQYENLERVDRRTIMTVVVLALATYFIVPQFSDLGTIVDQVKDANWAWFPLALLMSAMTYVMASVSMAGAIPDRVPAGPLTVTQVGASFTGTLAPAGLGGMALNVRFFQKQGVDHAVAASGVGLNAVAGVAAHAMLLGVFVLWAGQQAFGSFNYPEPWWVLVGIGAVAALLLLTLLIPATRRLFRERLWPMMKRSADGIGNVLSRPSKAVMLFGGSTAITLFYLATMFFCIEAFGGELPLATVGAVFLTGSAIATVAPTPGGLGAVEAALITGFTASGLPASIAIPSVFLFRLATFWLPILPGYFSFEWLQRNDYV